MPHSYNKKVSTGIPRPILETRHYQGSNSTFDFQEVKWWYFSRYTKWVPIHMSNKISKHDTRITLNCLRSPNPNFPLNTKCWQYCPQARLALAFPACDELDATLPACDALLVMHPIHPLLTGLGTHRCTNIIWVQRQWCMSIRIVSKSCVRTVHTHWLQAYH